VIVIENRGLDDQPCGTPRKDQAGAAVDCAVGDLHVGGATITQHEYTLVVVVNVIPTRTSHVDIRERDVTWAGAVERGTTADFGTEIIGDEFHSVTCAAVDHEPTSVRIRGKIESARVCRMNRYHRIECAGPT